MSTSWKARSKLAVSVLMPNCNAVASSFPGRMPRLYRYSVMMVEVAPYSLRISLKSATTGCSSTSGWWSMTSEKCRSLNEGWWWGCESTTAKRSNWADSVGVSLTMGMRR